MPPKSPPDAYDAFAWAYDRYWGGRFLAQVLPVIESHIPPGRLLDLCCGTGHLAAELSRRGYRVTGLDGSPALLALAKKRAPRADFRRADARRFKLPAEFDAAVSMFDSLNHMLTPDDLARAFRNARAALKPGGRFLFDLAFDEGYRLRWKPLGSIIERDAVVVWRATYTPPFLRDDLTIMRLVKKRWNRADVTLHQRAYTEGEIRLALQDTGFGPVDQFDSADLGRTFFLARA